MSPPHLELVSGSGSGSPHASSKRNSFMYEMAKEGVVFVEDDPDDIFFLQKAVEQVATFDASFVADGDELLEWLATRLVDVGVPALPKLIVLDLHMQGTDGRAALRRLKSISEFADIPVMVLTASISEFDLRSCYKAGASSFVTKPDSFMQLCDLVGTFEQFWLKTTPPRLLS